MTPSRDLLASRRDEVPRLTARRGSSLLRDPRLAIKQLREAIDQPEMRAAVLFCSPSYDLHRLGGALRDAFSCPVIGCTTAGQIGPDGYQPGGLVGVSLAGDIQIRPFLVTPVSECRQRAAELGSQIRSHLESSPIGRHAFGLLLVDGLSGCEEGLAAALYQSLGEVPIIGGSAGDDLRFERTAIYWDGEFLSGAAVFALFETSVEFCTFVVRDVAPTDRQLVITASDSARRLVREIDGLPAARGYARLLGIPTARLDASIYSQHPLLLRFGSDYHVRSIQRVNPDGSLVFYCAIEEGLVLTVGEVLDPVAPLEESLRAVDQAIGMPQLILGCDCVLRRLEQERRGLDARIGALLASHRVLGFSTYGEQNNALHMNQTFAGVALGERAWGA